MYLRAAVAAALVVTVASFTEYQNNIPNGDRVPNECEGTGLWEGVGHELVGGRGPLNPFGQDFADAGHTWTLALCSMDSDGDGRSNGVELGDPNCKWTAGSGTATLLDPTGHPGYCQSGCTSVCPSTSSTQHGHSGDPHGQSGDPHGHSGEHGHVGRR